MLTYTNQVPTWLQQHPGLRCQMYPVALDYNVWGALIMRKGWTFRESLDHTLKKLLERGVWDKMWGRARHAESEVDCERADPPDEGLESVGIESVEVFFKVVGAGVAAAVVIFFVEMVSKGKRVYCLKKDAYGTPH